MTENNETNIETESNTENEPDTSEYYDGLVDFIVDKWTKEGSVRDEEDTRECVGAMLFLISSYNLKCLINTLFCMYDLIEEYDEEIGLVEG